MRTIIERLNSKLQITTSGCVEWTGYRLISGYGRINIGGKTKMSHRVAWELTNGPIPDGMLVLHSCDNPPCCNIEHLWLGTQKENMSDMIKKGRNYYSQKTQCPQGHPYDEENTYRYPSGRRECRMCSRDRQRVSGKVG